MDDNLKDILSNLNKEIEQEKLLEYLNRNLSDADQHELEKQMNDDDFMSDAVEGLQQLGNKNAIAGYVQQLNADLRQQLNKKKERRNKRKIPGQYWTYISIILLLLLIVIAYVIIKKMQ
jgi:hypothetical protein